MGYCFRRKVSQFPAVQADWLEGTIMSIAKSEMFEIIVTNTGAIWQWEKSSGKTFLDDDWWKVHHPDWRRVVRQFVQDQGLGVIDEAMILAKVAELPAWFPWCSPKLCTSESRAEEFTGASAESIRRRAGLEKISHLPRYLVEALVKERNDHLGAVLMDHYRLE